MLLYSTTRAWLAPQNSGPACPASPHRRVAPTCRHRLPKAPQPTDSAPRCPAINEPSRVRSHSRRMMPYPTPLTRSDWLSPHPRIRGKCFLGPNLRFPSTYTLGVGGRTSPPKSTTLTGNLPRGARCTVWGALIGCGLRGHLRFEGQPSSSLSPFGGWPMMGEISLASPSFSSWLLLLLLLWPSCFCDCTFFRP